MKLSISTASVHPMRNALRKLRSGKLSRNEMDRVLSNKDYNIELNFYAQPDLPVCNIKKNDFLDYIMACQKLDAEDILNERLSRRHEDMDWFMSHLDSMNDSALAMFELKPGDISRIEQCVSMCLPDDLLEKLGDMTILFTIGIGDIFGWIDGKNIHFDVVHLMRSVHDKEALIVTVTHQLIHLLMTDMLDELPVLSPLEEFLLSFAYEGIAVKFANNAGGILSNPIRPNKNVNAFLDKKSWEHHTREFPLALAKLKSDIREIRYNNPSHSEAGALVQDFWLRSDIVSLCDEQKVFVKLYRNYFMGSEIFGAIYDCFGKERLISVLRNPIDIIPAFNDAAKMKGHEEFAIL